MCRHQIKLKHRSWTMRARAQTNRATRPIRLAVAIRILKTGVLAPSLRFFPRPVTRKFDAGAIPENKGRLAEPVHREDIPVRRRLCVFGHGNRSEAGALLRWGKYPSSLSNREE